MQTGRLFCGVENRTVEVNMYVYILPSNIQIHKKGKFLLRFKLFR